MKLARFASASGAPCVGIVEGDQLCPLRSTPEAATLAQILATDDPAATATSLIDAAANPLPLANARLLAPIDRQEVWAAGVTYRRSQVARMEESVDGATFYDKVYVAPRPEIFFKATPHRVRGPGEALRIRGDANWNVPEPELALVLDPRMRLVGFTVGNDLSSRDIEGENPLYLPQAKTFDACCGLGPWITLVNAMPTLDQITIRLTVRRGDGVAFAGATHAGQMARSFDELIGWLARECSFPDGAILLTGTGIVPDDHFTLAVDDSVEITIAGIGTLTNSIVRGPSR
jgi:2-dehydro-3-deoxy-D-arabinonate dehydratase